MRPRITEPDEFFSSTQGYGTLDCISCEVTEELNGIYELTAKVHIGCRHFEKIVEGNIITATHSNKGDLQQFQIYKVSRAIDGIVTVYAEHISYRLNKNVVKPFTATGLQATLAAIKVNAVDDCSFTFTSDKTSSAKFTVKQPTTIKSLLYGSEGSLVDVYGGGEYEYDNFTVRLWERRGEDNGVKIRYGKNLTDILKETDISDIYTAVVPFWTGKNENDQDVTVVLQEKTVRSEYVDNFPTPRTIPLDLSSYFEGPPSQEALRAKAQSYINANVRRQLVTTIRTSYIDLSITDEYKNHAEVMSVNLGDYVTVTYEALGVEDKQEVVKVVYDVLLDRNKTVEFGDAKKTLANTMRARDTGVRSLINRSSETTKKELTQNINNTKETLIREINTTKENCQTELEKIKRELQQEIDELKQQNPTDKIYPVGSIYLTVGAENPEALFGGTWKMIETGRYLRSAAAGGAEAKGGSTKHSHTYKWVTESMMRLSSNGQNADNAAFAGYPVVEKSEPYWDTIVSEEDTESGMGTIYVTLNQDAMTYYIDTESPDGKTTGKKFVARTDEAEVTPPYMDVYMWQRTA